MATAYDTWLEGDCGVDEAAEAREERIDARTEELVAEMADDEAKVLEAVEDINTLGFDGFLDRAVRDFLTSYRAAPDRAEPVAECARSLFDRLWPTVEAYMRREASTEAEAEEDRLDQLSDDMRAGL